MSDTKNIIIEGLLPDGKCFNVILKASSSVRYLKRCIYAQKFIHPHGYYLTANGVCLEDDEEITCSPLSSFMILRGHPLLYGGKGGFGTLIRAMGTQINKGSRKGACRDLSGRRMRDVEAEKKMAKWMAEEPERKRKKIEEKRKRLEQRRSEPKHHFNDSSYLNQIRSTEENMNVALQQGMQAAATATDSKGVKRKLPELSLGGTRKKQKMWVGIDGSSDEHSDSNASDEEPENSIEEPISLGEASIPCSSTSCDVPVTSNNMSGDSKIDSPKNVFLKSGENKAESPDLTSKKPMLHNKDEDANQVQLKVINLEDFSNVEDLVAVGGDQLKYSLQSMGLKCGGTVTERAQRLFSTKGKSIEEIDPSLFSKGSKRKNKVQ